jgi:large subunit ribosomal protein L2
MANTKKIFFKKKPEKSLLRPLKKTGGRGRTGRITVRHKGGGAKRRYRLIDFGQKKIIPAKVESVEYDPNRTCHIALLKYEDGSHAYILAPHGIKVGDEIIYNEKTTFLIGNRMKLKNIPVGTFVYNVELEPGKGGRIARAAGNACQILGQEDKYTILRMPSTEVRKVLGECFASIGGPSNPQHRFRKSTNAGRSRLKGIRPTVRGSAMSPVAHPHGGGEGRSPIGLKHPKTPWGKPALGVKTRNKNKWTNRLIIQRRKKKKKNK